MRVLIACEYSGRTREAFREIGHDAWSCDLLPAEDGSKYHYQCDVRKVIDKNWDLLIAHPDCTYLTVSAEWCYKDTQAKKMRPGVLYGADRRLAREEAVEFVRFLMSAPIDKIAIENPIGCLSSRIRKPDQIIQPYEYGDDASKSTCLWLKNLSLSYAQLSGAMGGSSHIRGNRSSAGRTRQIAGKTGFLPQKTAGRKEAELTSVGQKPWLSSGEAS